MNDQLIHMGLECIATHSSRANTPQPCPNDSANANRMMIDASTF